MTERFVSAAEMMSRVLGMPDYRFARDRPSGQQRHRRRSRRRWPGSRSTQGRSADREALNPAPFMWNFCRNHARYGCWEIRKRTGSYEP